MVFAVLRNLRHCEFLLTAEIGVEVACAAELPTTCRLMVAESGAGIAEAAQHRSSLSCLPALAFPGVIALISWWPILTAP